MMKIIGLLQKDIMVSKTKEEVGFICNQHEVIDQVFFENKIKKALDERKTRFEDADTTAFRVFNSEGDGIGGLIIDYYDGYYVMSWYSEGIYQFKEYIIEALRVCA